mmetsp:Transcript_13551/g.39078  ORF Transcript_13551/g.39078 Transcript_13551/m.39078 type:complete len:95 (+) Transcript_13551:840-1124(+)
MAHAGLNASMPNSLQKKKKSSIVSRNRPLAMSVSRKGRRLTSRGGHILTRLQQPHIDEGGRQDGQERCQPQKVDVRGVGSEWTCRHFGLPRGGM